VILYLNENIVNLVFSLTVRELGKNKTSSKIQKHSQVEQKFIKVPISLEQKFINL